MAFFLQVFPPKPHKENWKNSKKKDVFFTFICDAPQLVPYVAAWLIHPLSQVLYDNSHDPPTDEPCHNVYQCTMCITLRVSDSGEVLFKQ